jgi:hypothetical protein
MAETSALGTPIALGFEQEPTFALRRFLLEVNGTLLAF